MPLCEDHILRAHMSVMSITEIQEPEEWISSTVSESNTVPTIASIDSVRHLFPRFASGGISVMYPDEKFPPTF